MENEDMKAMVNEFTKHHNQSL